MRRPKKTCPVTEAGIRYIDYKDERFKAGVYGGTMDYADILGSDRVESYLLRGIWGEGRPIDEVATTVQKEQQAKHPTFGRVNGVAGAARAAYNEAP